MEQFFIILILGILLTGVLLLINFLTKEKTTWISGDNAIEDSTQKLQTQIDRKTRIENQNTTNLKSEWVFILTTLSVVFIVFLIIKNKQSDLSDSNFLHQDVIGFENANIDTFSSEIQSESFPTNDQVKDKLSNYFSKINSRDFINISTFFASNLSKYFKYQNVNNAFVSNDVESYWSDQIQPAGIYFNMDEFEVQKGVETYIISGNIIEKSSFSKDKIPYILYSRVNYQLNTSLLITSIEGEIYDKVPDLERIFGIKGESIDEIKGRENVNDFDLIFSKLKSEYEESPNLTIGYIKAVREFYGPQLLVYFRGSFYSFEEFSLNISFVNSASLLGVETVVTSPSGNKVVTINY